MPKELFKITKEGDKYVLYVMGKARFEDENIDVVTAEIFRICII